MKKIFKKIIAAALGSVIMLTSVPFSVFGADVTITKSGGWYEYAFVQWSGSGSATVEYKETTAADSTYTAVDSELIRDNRVDIPGLKGDTAYTIKVTVDGASSETTVKTMSYNRDGYAHFNSSGVGAYNDDGTLKSNADVIYVTNATKNSVTYGSYKGIANILSNASKISKPLAIRIIGTVDTQTRDADGTKTTDKNNGVVAINGLVDTSSGSDSNFNMCEIKGASNLTIEGIGTDALIDKWGMVIKNDAKSCEIRNLGFQRYPEDATAIEGANNVWIHNNDFESGENKYDLTSEQDKHYGDGSTDIKKSYYITISGNYYHNGHKTSLIGASSSQYQDWITFSGNVFDATAERTPRVRNAHVHVYNNYYKDVTGYGIGASYNSKIFSEANYFENTNIPITMGPVGSDKYGGTVKSWADIFVDCYEITNPDSAKTGTSYTAASSRDEKTSIANPKSGGDAYDNFDISTSNFYYNSYSVVSAQQAKSDNMVYAGRLNADSGYNGASGGESTTETSESTTVSTESTTSADSTTETTTLTTDTTTEITTQTTTETTTVTETTTESTTHAPVSDIVITDGLFAGVDYGNIFVLEDMPFVSGETTFDGVTYPGWAAGTNNPSTSNDVPTKGAAIKVTPQYDGVFTLTFKLNASKSYYAVESDGTRLETLTNSSADPVCYTKVYNLTGGKEYYFYCKGSKIPVLAMSLDEDKPVTLIYGDADNSGTLTSNDAAQILASSLGGFTSELESAYPNYAFKYLDVNNDGALTAADAALVLNRTLDSSILFPAEG